MAVFPHGEVMSVRTPDRIEPSSSIEQPLASRADTNQGNYESTRPTAE